MTMTTSRVTKWGNSLAIRIPHHVAKAASLTEGSSVTLTVEGDALLVRRSRPRFRLSDLLKAEARSGEAW